MAYFIDPSKWRETVVPTHRDTGLCLHFRVCLWVEGFTWQRKDVDKLIRMVNKMRPPAKLKAHWHHGDIVRADWDFIYPAGRTTLMTFGRSNVPFAPANHIPLYWPYGVQHWVPIPPQVDRLQALSFDEAVMDREAPLEAYADWLCEQGWDERWKLATKELERAGRQADSFDA